MLNFFHSFSPQAILFSWGPIHVYWYGLLMVLAILTALAVVFYLAKLGRINRERIFDLSFWLIIGGLIGARIYDIFLDLSYYLQHPWQILKVWEGGLSIHGAIIFGLAIVWLFARRYKINFWQLSAVLVPGLAIGQAIGRWGNYFNQELFGLPTNGSLGIPIAIENRPGEYFNYEYFQPAFLYESLGCLIIGGLLILWYYQKAKKGIINVRFSVWISSLYMILYSILRFGLEFIKINPTPILFGLRWPQIMSLVIIIIFAIILLLQKHVAHPSEKNQKE